MCRTHRPSSEIILKCRSFENVQCVMQTDFFGLSIKLSYKLIWTGRNFVFRNRLTKSPSVFHEGKLFNDVKWDKMSYINNDFSKKIICFEKKLKKFLKRLLS
jgi:hypothetical protein